MPLAEVRLTAGFKKLPELTATNWVPAQVAATSGWFVPALREVQVSPSGEVRMTDGLLPPSPPTATNNDFDADQVTPASLALTPETLSFQ